MYDQPPDYRGYTKKEMREAAAYHRAKPSQDVEAEAFWNAYGAAGYGDLYGDEPTRGEALDLATRHLLKIGFNQWTWARCEPTRFGTEWLVTVGANRATYRVLVSKEDGSMIAREAGV